VIQNGGTLDYEALSVRLENLLQVDPDKNASSMKTPRISLKAFLLLDGKQFLASYNPIRGRFSKFPESAEIIRCNEKVGGPSQTGRGGDPPCLDIRGSEVELKKSKSSTSFRWTDFSDRMGRASFSICRRTT